MIQFGKRPLPSLLKSGFEPRHYVALKNIFALSPRPLSILGRYLSNRGSYPYKPKIRTPTGNIMPTLYSSHDLLTLNEIFFRLDYFADNTPKVVVDIGSNIGISALYFLTRNTHSRAYLFEPVPENAAKLKTNLSGYGRRYQLSETAVSDCSGALGFTTEATGRYGHLTDETAPDHIIVPCTHINAVLESVLSKEGKIDILKIDIEGCEEKVLKAIDPRFYERISVMYIECASDELQRIPCFARSRRGAVHTYS